MARFLFTVWPLTGHIYPNLTVAVALRELGHTVAFYTGDQARANIEREGFECLPFVEVKGDAYVEMMTAGYHAANPLDRAQRMKEVYRTWLVDTLSAQLLDLEKALADWHPDVIVCDPTMWAPILVLHEKHHIPVAVFSYTMGSFLPRPGSPPSGLGLPSPRNWWDRLVTTVYMQALTLATADIRQKANQIRRDNGLAPLKKSVAEHAGEMPLYLVTSVPELDGVNGSLPHNMHYVGPCLWSKSTPGPVPEWMERLPTDQPWVHVSEGTIHSQRPFLLLAAAEGLADLPVQVIIATGTHRNPSELGLDNLAPNIHVLSWVPYEHLLPRTSVLVTTGGAGTVMAALQAGIPMLVSPTEWDKPENAKRIVESGAGLRLSPEKITPTRLREAVRKLLDEPSFRENAQRLGRRFQEFDGPKQAAQLLEQLAPVQTA